MKALPHETKQRQRQSMGVAFLLLVVTVAIYWPVAAHQFITLDDQFYVTENERMPFGLCWENVRWAFMNLEAGFWHPLTWLSLLLDAQLFGLHPAGYHLTNLLFHVAGTLLLFVVLKDMTGAVWRSAFVAALYALHPLHVEPVAWVASRKDVLSALFGFGSLFFYVRYALAHGAASMSGEAGRRKAAYSVLPFSSSGSYWLALVFFALGLMSKAMVVTLPAVMLLLDCWPLGRFELANLNSQRLTVLRLIREKIPFLGLSVIVSLLTYYAERGIGAVSEVGPRLSLRMANALTAYIRYLGKIFWPVDLAVIYPYPLSYPFWQAAGSAILLLGISAWAIHLRRKPWLAVGWFWYLGTLLPVIGIVQVGLHSMADRYTYIPLVGLFIALTWGGAEMTSGWSYRRSALGFLALGALVGCAVTTRFQLRYWKGSERLFRHALSATADNWLAHDNLGAVLSQLGRVPEAIEQYEQALQLKPGYAQAHYNLGCALSQAGRVPEAIGEYEQALRLKPNYADPHYNLGCALLQVGRVPEAIWQYEQALRLKPRHAWAHNNLGTALLQLGRVADAIGHYEQALRLRPENAAAHYNLGNALLQSGKAPEAIWHLEEALRLKPDSADAHRNLGNALLQLGRVPEAAAHLQKSLLLSPDDADTHNALGMALVGQGKVSEAITHYERALQLNPNSADAHYNLGNAQVRRSRVAEAIKHYEHALQLRPQYAMAHNNLGNVLFQVGRVPEAVGHYEQALLLNPGYADARGNLGLALFQLGEGLAAQGNLDEAIRRYQRAVEVKPDHAQAHDGLGMALSRQGKSAEAVEHYRRALAIDPGLVTAQNHLAWVLATAEDPATRRVEEAVRCAERACELTTNSVAIHLDTLGVAYSEAGRFSEAVQAAERGAERARAAGDKELAALIESRLKHYREGRPYQKIPKGTGL